MAFPVVASSAKRSSSNTTSTSITLTAPSGITAGDVLLVWLVCSSGALTVSSSGWTILNQQVDNVNGVNLLQVWAYKVAGGSEPGSYTFTTSGTGGQWVGAILRLTGADTPVYGGRTTNTTTNTTLPHPSMNTPAADCLVVVGAHTQWVAQTLAAPAGFTEHQEDTSTGAADQTLNISSKGQTAAGATGVVNTTVSSNSGRKIGAVAAVPPGGAPAAPAFIPRIDHA